MITIFTKGRLALPIFFLLASVKCGAVVEAIEVNGPGGIQLTISSYPQYLHFYDGKVTPGQRIPKWTDAFRASMYPHTFESFEEWRSYFGHGPKEEEYMVEKVFNEARELPVVWPSYVNDSLKVPYVFTVSNSEIEYLVVPYHYSGNARYPDSLGKGHSARLRVFFREGGDWKMLVGDTPDFARQLGFFDSGRELVEHLEAGEFDDAFDFTVHYQSFPEYDPNAVVESSEPLASSIRDNAPSRAKSGDEGRTSSTDRPLATEEGSSQWWLWVVGAIALLGAGSVAMRLRR